MRVLVIGLSRELPLSPADALDIADKLVARAANAHSEGSANFLIVVVTVTLTAYDWGLRKRVPIV